MVEFGPTSLDRSYLDIRPQMRMQFYYNINGEIRDFGAQEMLRHHPIALKIWDNSGHPEAWAQWREQLLDVAESTPGIKATIPLASIVSDDRSERDVVLCGPYEKIRACLTFDSKLTDGDEYWLRKLDEHYERSKNEAEEYIERDKGRAA